MEDEYLVKWKDYQSNFFTLAEELFASELLTDVTLVCQDQVYEAHKIVLAVCSNYFRSVLTRTRFSTKEPVVFLKVMHIILDPLGRPESRQVSIIIFTRVVRPSIPLFEFFPNKTNLKWKYCWKCGSLMTDPCLVNSILIHKAASQSVRPSSLSKLSYK